MFITASKPEPMVVDGKVASVICSVYSTSEQTDGTWIDEGKNAFFSPNLDFLPHSGLNVSNANACYILDALGLGEHWGNDGCVSIEIGTAIAACEKWLARNTSAVPGIPSSITRGEQGATLIECGTQDGYLNDCIVRLFKCILVGQTRGATLLSAA